MVRDKGTDLEWMRRWGEKRERGGRGGGKAGNTTVAVVYSILTFKASPEEEFQTTSLTNDI